MKSAFPRWARADQTQIADANAAAHLKNVDFLRLRTVFQIIWGVHDEIIQYDSKVFPGNVLLKEIENAGHMVHMEQPKEFNQILKEYLKN